MIASFMPCGLLIQMHKISLNTVEINTFFILSFIIQSSFKRILLPNTQTFLLSYTTKTFAIREEGRKFPQKIFIVRVVGHSLLRKAVASPFLELSRVRLGKVWSNLG